MIKSLISVLLAATVAVAQTPPKASQTGGTGATKPTSTSAKSASGSAKAPSSTKATSGTASKAGSGATSSAKNTGASAVVTKPSASTVPPRPLPEHSLRTKLKNDDNLNPNYEKEKARGRGLKREYTPRRTASGVRKDTMNQRRP